MPLYFNADHLSAQINEYVAWVDVMGTQASMSRSLSATANFIFKLHAAALQAPHANMTLYPVMDGIYAAAASQADMVAFLRSVFQEVAHEFNDQPNNMYRFVARGALAFGPVVHGRDLPQAASNTLAANPAYRDQILLGIPMVQAHLSEASAPPFGVAVHESARAFAPTGSQPLHAIWWKWATQANQAVWDALGGHLENYFQWYAARSAALGYPADRIKAHREMAQQYFAL
jgi:hypothetical protein